MRARTTPAPMPLRVVIDTNILVSALVFRSGPPAKIRAAWQAGAIIPVVSRVTTQELLRVLQYPKFSLTAEEQQTLLAAYLPYCETHPEPRTRKRIPICRDAADQAFLLLAVAAKADALITGDKDLVALAGKAGVEIVLAAEFLARVS